MAKKKITQEELDAITKHFKHVTACLERGVSGCCEAKLVPAKLATVDDIRRGCPRYCSKCGTYCACF